MLGWPAITQSESSNSVWSAKCSDSKSQVTQACEPERDEEGTTRHAWTLAGFRCKVGCRWWKTCTSCQVLTTSLLACFRMVWRIRGFLHCHWLLTHCKGLREGGLHQLISWVTLGFIWSEWLWVLPLFGGLASTSQDVHKLDILLCCYWHFKISWRA